MAIPPAEREPHGNLPYFIKVSQLLGGGVDIDDLPAPAVYGAAAVNAPGALVDKGRVAVIKNLLVIVILVAERTGDLIDELESNGMYF